MQGEKLHSFTIPNLATARNKTQKAKMQASAGKNSKLGHGVSEPLVQRLSRHQCTSAAVYFNTCPPKFLDSV